MINKKNIKQIIQEAFKNVISEEKYYNSHGQPMSMQEFIEIEVEDRDNYKMKQVERWMKKYKINLDDEVIWVTPDKKMANRYNLPVNDWWKYEEVPEEEIEVFEYDSSEGFIIPESDDGDDGFLFVFRKKEENKPQLNETRMVTFAGQIASDIKKSVPGIEKQLGLYYISDGITGLYRYEDGNAYEITIKPVKFAQYKDFWKKLTKQEPPKEQEPDLKKLASDASLNEKEG